MQALGAPIHQLEGVRCRLTAHALIAGVGDAIVASARLQAHGQDVGLVPLAAAGSMHILCKFGLGVECPVAAAGLRCALEAVCAEHAASSYCFVVHGGPGNLTGESSLNAVVRQNTCQAVRADAAAALLQAPLARGKLLRHRS